MNFLPYSEREDFEAAVCEVGLHGCLDEAIICHALVRCCHLTQHQRNHDSFAFNYFCTLLRAYVQSSK